MLDSSPGPRRSAAPTAPPRAMRAARRSDGCACARSRRRRPFTTASCPTRPATRSPLRPPLRSTARSRGSRSTRRAGRPARAEPSEEEQLGQHQSGAERDLCGRPGPRARAGSLVWRFCGALLRAFCGVCPRPRRGLLARGKREGRGMTSQRRGELEKVIGEVAASYGAGRLIDSLSSAQLPNKRQVIEALNHLKAVMYLGYYSTGSLDESKLRFALASHLYPAYDILVEQIGRAASYEGFRSAGVPRDQDWPETVTVALLRKVPAIRALLSKDVIAAFQGDPAANSVEEVIFSYPSIEAITTHRIAHELYRERVPMLPRIMAEHAHTDTGID